MRPIDTATAAALMGSRSGDQLIAHAWYGGQLVSPNLPISAWSIAEDDTAQVKGTLSLTVTDETNKLTPWLLEDPLGVGGAEIQTFHKVGGAGIVNVGWYRINGNAPDEVWRTYVINNRGAINADSTLPPGKSLTMVPGGSEIHVTAVDRTVNAVNASLLAPESPPTATQPTVISEVTRLLDGKLRVVVAAGVVDKNVSASLVYGKDRLNEVENLLSGISCSHRMNGDGSLEIYPITPLAPVWTVRGGDEGALVKVNHASSLDKLYNVVVADGTQTVTKNDGTTTQVPVRGIAKLIDGPLRSGGPHGDFVYFHQSPLITTQSDADKTAQTMLANLVTSQTLDLAVECLPNPALQQGDWVTVMNPVVDGRQIPVVGRVIKRGISGTKTTVNRMTLTVRCSYKDVTTAMSGVTRG